MRRLGNPPRFRKAKRMEPAHSETASSSRDYHSPHRPEKEPLRKRLNRCLNWNIGTAGGDLQKIIQAGGFILFRFLYQFHRVSEKTPFMPLRRGGWDCGAECSGEFGYRHRSAGREGGAGVGRHRPLDGRISVNPDKRPPALQSIYFSAPFPLRRTGLDGWGPWGQD